MASVIGSVALREWFIKDGCSWSDAGLVTAYASDFMEMLGISAEDQQTIRKESEQHQSAKAIQNAWRKYDSTRWKYSSCDTGNCGECDACYYECMWCCPYCGDQCDYKETFKGFCSEQCMLHIGDEYLGYDYDRPQQQDGEEEAEDHDHSESESEDDFEPCDRCGRNASGQGYPGGSYCSRACFVYYD